MDKPSLQQRQPLPGTVDTWAGQAEFFSGSETDGQTIQESLGRARVAILGAGRIAAHARAALGGAGLHDLRTLDAAAVSPAHLEGLDCVLACLDAPNPALLGILNGAALETHVPWITGLVEGGVGRVGPTIFPGQSPCYRCYEARCIANLDGRAPARTPRVAPQDGFVAPFAFAALMGGFLALDAVRLLTGLTTPQTVGRVALLDFYASEITYHRILRLPNCPACGYGKRQAAAMQEV